MVASARHDAYQIPNTPDDQAGGIDDNERESDAFVNVSWVRTFASGALLTVSPFYHYNSANYEGGAGDFPIATTDERRVAPTAARRRPSAATVGKQDLQVGFYGFHQQDDERFALVFNDVSRDDFSVRVRPSGNLAAVFAAGQGARHVVADDHRRRAADAFLGQLRRERDESARRARPCSSRRSTGSCAASTGASIRRRRS